MAAVIIEVGPADRGRTRGDPCFGGGQLIERLGGHPLGVSAGASSRQAPGAGRTNGYVGYVEVTGW